MGRLIAHGLAKSFGEQELFRDVNFQIASGDKVGLVGANGCGKTTLFKIIMGQEMCDDGEVNFENVSVGYVEQQADLGEGTLYEELKTAFADIIALGRQKAELEKIISQNDDPTQLDKYSQVMNNFERLEGYDYENRLRRVAFGLGFTENDFSLNVANFSGGEKTRALLAKALLREPEFLLLDEPTNHLDISMIEWLEEFLAAYKGSVLIISHDRFFLDRTVTRIIELDNHTTEVYEGNYSKFAQVKAERRLALQAAYEKQQDYIKKTEEYIRQYKAGIKAKQARGRQSQLNRLSRIVLPAQAASFQYFAFHKPLECADRVVELEDVAMRFDDTELFREVNLLIRRGDGIALVGANGTGKTTLLKLLLGSLSPAKGKIKIGNRVQIGYFSQQHEGLHPERTVLDEILYDDYGVEEQEARNYLGAFGFRGDDVYARVGDLSGGEQSRLAFLKLMLTGANFLILDEPTNHLDIPAKEAVEEALLTFPGTFLVVSHDRYFLNKVAGTIWELSEGKITEYRGDFAYYLSRKQFTEQTEAIKPTKQAAAQKSMRKKEPPARQKSESASPSFLQLSESKRQELIGKLEAEIAMAEAELKGLEYEMNLPENQADPQKSQDIAARYAAKEQEIEMRYRKWAQVSEV